MTGLQLISSTYRQNGQDRKADLMTFLSECSQTDICSLYDSAVFNEITRSYVRKAVTELVTEGVLTDQQARAVRNRINVLFSELTAEEVST